MTDTMGNEIAKKYDVQEVPRGTAGPRGVWNVYDGVERRTNTLVSVFIFDKGVLEQVPKGSREDVLNILRNDMKMLVTYVVTRWRCTGVSLALLTCSLCTCPA